MDQRFLSADNTIWYLLAMIFKYTLRYCTIEICCPLNKVLWNNCVIFKASEQLLRGFFSLVDNMNVCLGDISYIVCCTVNKEWNNWNWNYNSRAGMILLHMHCGIEITFSHIELVDWKQCSYTALDNITCNVLTMYSSYCPRFIYIIWILD